METSSAQGSPSPFDRLLRVGIQADSMGRDGGLEQVIYDLVRTFDPARVRPTLLVNNRSPGYFGERLRDEGFDVAVLGRDEQTAERVARERSFDLVNLHYSVFGTSLYRRLGIPTVYTVHNSYTWMPTRERIRRRRAFDEVDLFLAVSRQVKDFFVSTFAVDEGRVQVAPNGVGVRGLDSPAPLTRADLGWAPDDVVFVHVGAFNWVKCQRLTVTAFQELARDCPRARLVFVGPPAIPEYVHEVQRCIRRAGLGDRIHVLGSRPRPELAAILRNSNCFVLPSLQEGWSIAAMEAMYFGLPLILSDVGSARDIIREDDIGQVVRNPFRSLAEIGKPDWVRFSLMNRPPNLPSLVEAMRAVYDRPEEWKRKAAVGRARVTTEYTMEAMAACYERAYRQVLGSGREVASGS